MRFRLQSGKKRGEESYKIRYFDNVVGWKREGSFSIDFFITGVDPFLFSLSTRKRAVIPIFIPQLISMLDYLRGLKLTFC